MRISTSAAVLAALFFLINPGPADAQNTSGVFGPSVKEGDRGIEYRTSYDSDSDGFAHRLHYQEALNSKWRWRVLAQTRTTEDSDFDFNYVRGELVWDITDESRFWQTGMRFEARIRDRGRPADIGVHWTNQFQLSPNWQARLIALSYVFVGDDAPGGIGISTRANLSYAFNDRQKFGVEMFSSYGTTDDFADFDEQAHQLGPFTTLSFDDDWSLFAGALFGLTDRTADSELRLWLSRDF